MKNIGKIYSPKIALVISLLPAFYVIVFSVYPPYETVFIGALFEILWLPILAILFLAPLLSMWILLKKKTDRKLAYLLSILVCAFTFAFLIFTQ